MVKRNSAGKEETFVGVRVKLPIFLSDFNQIWVFLVTFSQRPPHPHIKFKGNPSSGSRADADGRNEATRPLYATVQNVTPWSRVIFVILIFPAFLWNTKSLRIPFSDLFLSQINPFTSWHYFLEIQFNIIPRYSKPLLQFMFLSAPCGQVCAVFFLNNLLHRQYIQGVQK